MPVSPPSNKGLIVPKSLEAPRAKFDVPKRVLDIPMTEVRLNKSKIRTAFSQVVPTGVPEHVRMWIQGSKASAFCRPVKHKLDRPRRQGPAPLRRKDKIGCLGTFPEKPAQRPNFYPAQVMVAAQATFQPLDVENPPVKVKLLPAGLQAFADAQSVSEEDHNKRSVPVAVAAFARRLHQFLHFGLEKMFPLPGPTLRHCSLYGNRYHVAHGWNPQVFHRVASLHCS